MTRRQGNNPKRRIIAAATLTLEQRKELAERLPYEGSAHHKRYPGNYDFAPPVNPRPTKSLCDATRTILKLEAQRLLYDGVMKGMLSALREDGTPKFVWSVDEEGQPYEAKWGRSGYHGYRLEEEDEMRDVVLQEWKLRCQN